MNKGNPFAGLIRMLVIVAAVLGMMFGFYKLEMVNYNTTHDGLIDLIGGSYEEMAMLLAQGVVAMDIGALFLLFIPSPLNKNANSRGILKKIWSLTMGADSLLTLMYFAERIYANRANTPSVIDGFLWIMPIGITVLVTTAQATVLYYLGSQFGALLNEVQPSFAKASAKGGVLGGIGKLFSKQKNIPGARTVTNDPVMAGQPGFRPARPGSGNPNNRQGASHPATPSPLTTFTTGDNHGYKPNPYE